MKVKVWIVDVNQTAAVVLVFSCEGKLTPNTVSVLAEDIG